MAFGSFIRFNPERAPTQAKIGGGAIPQIGAVNHVASSVGGPMSSYLGHFGQKNNLMAGHNTMHPGFKAVQGKIAKREGVSSARAGAILAASTRKASPAARKRNPRLNRVK